MIYPTKFGSRLQSIRMDTRAIVFSVVLVLTIINCPVRGLTTVSTVTTVVTSNVTAPTVKTPPVKPTVTTLTVKTASGKPTVTAPTASVASNVNGIVSKAGASKPTTKTTTTPTTTPPPIHCKVGVCNGTEDDCLNSTSTVKQQFCTSGDSCAVVQRDINGTYSHYTFSCAKDCSVLAKQGKAACCHTDKCTPDLTKPLSDNSGGDSIVPSNIMSFFCVTILSVLVM